MSIEVVPDEIDLDVDLDFVGGPLEISGIPTAFSLAVTDLPKIEVGLDPITINPLTINPLTINPLEVSVRIKEIPQVRAHIPADFSASLSLLGFPVLCLRLCGEAQVITEPYQRNPCEHCGDQRRPTTEPR